MNLKNFAMGLEFGSTRIKAILLDEERNVIASGGHTWENRYIDGIWTYTMDDIIGGLQDCYSKMREDFEAKYETKLTELGAIGISGMMHGYLAFDKDNNLLAPFRTWRNTITEVAATTLTKAFNAAIPQRWSIAHLYKDILEDVSYVKDITHFTTLAGFIHWQLTGNKVLGIGEASGMFPIDSAKCDYRDDLLDIFADLIKDKSYPWTLKELLPGVLNAGECAGYLTEEGAKLLDVSGTLKAGAKVAPPEGDAGTGMTATNSVRVGTGNVSAGTSVFAMVVTEKTPKLHKEINVVTTPDGAPVAMVHCNNCTSDIDAWVKLFSQVLDSFGCEYKKYELYDKLYNMALSADENCGGVVTYNLFSGETILDNIPEGRPMMVRMPDADFSFPNLAKSLIYSSFATLKIGMDILTEKENVKVEMLLGHGGLFKTKDVAQILMSSALSVPVSVMTTAAEGGAWGIATLAQFLKNKSEGETLSEYLDNRVFASAEVSIKEPDAKEKAVFDRYIEKYAAGVAIQKAAIESLK